MFFFACSFSIFTFGSCDNNDPEISDSELPKCTDFGDYLMEYKKIKNEKAYIEIRISQNLESYDTTYLVNYSKDLYRYFDGCNLPSEFKKDSLQIIFSGTVYIPKDHEKVILGSLPIELSNIQINTSK
jgi:hypothetical protein